jgi:hypothetical protein
MLNDESKLPMFKIRNGGGRPMAEQTGGARQSGFWSSFLTIVALPVVGAALIVMVQAIFPGQVERLKDRFLGSTFGPYFLLRVNDADASKPPIVTNLPFTENAGLLSGELHIEPDGSTNIPPEGGRRVYRGFLGGDGFLVLAYRSDPHMHGIGEYFSLRLTVAITLDMAA